MSKPNRGELHRRLFIQWVVLSVMIAFVGMTILPAFFNQYPIMNIEFALGGMATAGLAMYGFYNSLVIEALYERLDRHE